MAELQYYFSFYLTTGMKPAYEQKKLLRPVLYYITTYITIYS